MDSQQSNQLRSWLSLVRDIRFSSLQKRQLLTHYLCPTVIYQHSYQQLCAWLGVPVNHQKDTEFRNKTELGLKKDIQWLEQANHHLLCWNDDDYPELLKQINDPPICLFASGNLQLLSEPKVSVVGSRRPTPVGAKVTQRISTDLAQLGIVITSGMALGVDALSHQAALAINEPTIAVMGCGLDIIAPTRHRALFEQITEQGLAVSEYPIAHPASKYTFPQRNRIVSGLSYGVIIVEAADKSGTLITARLAIEQNREVMVVPGSPHNPQYVGSHRLIRQGASLVACAEEVLAELNGYLQEVLNTDTRKPKVLSKVTTDSSLTNEQIVVDYPVLSHIDYEPTTMDKIILSSGLTASEVSSMLLILELEGLVTVTSDGSYQRIL